ncbi:MAG: HAMP domain-containing protein [Burkholderiales bacterium]|nr:HAMP domain-containing protein [Burkholderiales bacterium]
MRTRLAHTLSFWLLGAVALSVLAMGGLSAWNLRQGFNAYLQARDLERLDAFVALVADRLAQADGSTADAAPPPDMGALLRELEMRLGVPAPAQPRRVPPDGLPGGPPGAEDSFGARVTLQRPDGRPWVGPPIDGDVPGVIERPIVLRGEVVARALLRPLALAPDAIDRQFLLSQYLGIAAVAAVLLGLALGGALWLARQWVRPLLAVQAATTRIAQGELDVRVPVERDDEIGDVVRNVNAMAVSLQRIEGARRRWLADLSHELRTPLTVLRGEIEALVDGVRQPNQAALLSLREDALRLGRLIDDLHLLAMADLQALPCHFADADAVQIVRDVLQRHAGLAADAGLTLGWGQEPGAPVAVHWDAARIEQLLSNLLQNSLRYTDAPGRIALTLQQEAGRVHLVVDDSAPGVPAPDLPRVFEPLYRADAARGRHNGGSGLGLAICAAIAAAHGGRIDASASALGGLRVRVELPLRAAAVGA